MLVMGLNTVQHRANLLTGEPRTSVISRIQIQHTMKATHFLESQGIAVISRDQIQSMTEATHLLESQKQLSSVRFKYSSPQKQLTSWKDKNRIHEQGQNVVHHRSHS